MLRFAAAALICLGPASAGATVLTFDFGGMTQDQIPDDYGDRVITTNDLVNGFMYGMGNGFTPNVVVDYAADTGFFDLWETGYGDLENALGHTLFEQTGEIVLTPDPGFRVTLNSFDVAGWLTQTEWPDSQVLILDAVGNILFDSGLITISSTGHVSFPGSPVSSATALRIQLVNFGDLGLDNVNFDQSLVPIPAAVWLFGSALAGLALSRRRAHVEA